MTQVNGPSQPPQFERKTGSEQNITHQKGVGQGRETNRLILTGGDKVFEVAAKHIGQNPKTTLSSLIRHFTHVKVKTSDSNNNFELNVRSCAKRLGISQKEVKEIAKQGDQAIAALQNKAKIREAALTKYEGIANTYVKEKGKLSTDGGLETGLKPKTLLKAIQKGMTIEDNNAVFNAQKIKTGKYTFYATKDLGKLHFVQGKLGAGAYGTVFKTVELNNAEMRALKVTSTKEKAMKELNNEHTVLTDLGNHEGIPDAPSEITLISEKGIKSAFCDMTLMSSDLRGDGTFVPNFQELPAGDRLKLCGQLLNGLTYMHSKGYRHGDIKPNNCLVRNGADGKPEKFVISDFGGACKGAPETSTERYEPMGAQNNSDSAEKQDVYAMAKTLIEVLGATSSLTGSRIPLVYGSDEAKQIIAHLKDCGITESVAKVLIRGLGEEEDRPTAAKFKESFDNAVSNMSEDEKNALSRFGFIQASLGGFE